MVIVEIPFDYAASVTPVRCRNPITVIVERARLAVRIDVAGSDEAPLVATMQAPPRGGGAVVDYPELYRCHKGRLLRRVTFQPTWNRPREALRLEGLQRTLDEIAHTPHRSPFGFPQPIKDSDGTMREGAPVRFRHWDNRAAREALVRSKLDGATSVDGHVYVRSNGPCWIVSASNGGAHIQAHRELYASPSTFRADRLHEAVQSAEASQAAFLAAGPRRRAEPVSFSGSIDVLLPEAFTADDDWLAYTDCLRRFVACSAKLVGGWRRPLCEAWLDVRDSLASEWPDSLDLPTMDKVSNVARMIGPKMEEIQGSSELRRATERLAHRTEERAAPGPAGRTP